MGRRPPSPKNRPLTVASSCKESPAPFLYSLAAPQIAQTGPHVDENGRIAREFASKQIVSSAVAPPARPVFGFDPTGFRLRESGRTAWDVHPQQSFGSTS